MFKQNGIIYIFFDELLTMMILNLCFISTAIFIFTIGPSLESLYYVHYQRIEKKEFSFKMYYLEFFKEMKKTYKLVIVLNLMMFFMILNILIFNTYEDSNYIVLVFKYLMYILLIIMFFFQLFIYPIRARFENNLLDSILNTLLFMFNYKFNLLMIFLILFGVVFLSIYNTFTFAWAILFYLLFGFSLITRILASYFLEMFKKHDNRGKKYERI